jgi:hypothetical protein
MKIHYISCHSILEYDEVQLLTDLGHDVFSNGAYIDPRGHITLPRPPIAGAVYHEDYANLSINFPKTNLPPELIEPFDVIIIMHHPDVIVQNWNKIKHKKVVWRTIGQSTTSVEASLEPMRKEGLKIIRYSPKERNLSNYIGEDVLIRFCKDEDAYSGWIGSGGVVTFAQSLKGRRSHCHYEEIIDVITKYSGFVYGPGNDDLGELNGGSISYFAQIKKMQESRVMIYGGTAPASYTLSFIEAMMMGLPIVAISKQLANIIYDFDFYEVDEILAPIGGLVCDNVDQMFEKTKMMLNDIDFAKEMSEKQRGLAIEMFGKKKIIKQWEDFLGSL